MYTLCRRALICELSKQQQIANKHFHDFSLIYISTTFDKKRQRFSKTGLEIRWNQGQTTWLIQNMCHFALICLDLSVLYCLNETSLVSKTNWSVSFNCKGNSAVRDCYLHNITEVRKATSSNRRYFNWIVQAKEKTIRAVCYSQRSERSSKPLQQQRAQSK